MISSVTKQSDSKYLNLPDRNCALCPRLMAFREQNRIRFADWHNAPVCAFGSLQTEFLIVGLGPGLRGANRTGRPFTGDYAGDLLYETLLATGFAKGRYDKRVDDGLQLTGCRITNAVRCVPPANKPETAEIYACQTYLAAELNAMPALQLVLALGTVAHRSLLQTCAIKNQGKRMADYPFSHGAFHKLPNGLILANSYHCSRYNTNTGRLTPLMFQTVIQKIQRELQKLKPIRTSKTAL